MRIERRHAWLLPIAAVHGVLLLEALREHPTELTPNRVVSVRLMTPSPRAATTRAKAARTPRPRQPAILARPHPLVLPDQQRSSAGPASEGMPEPIATSQPTAEQPTVDTAAPAAPSAASLLQTEATRRAIRDATRQPLLSERAASASQDTGRETTQARMGRNIQQAGTTDCLKGEFLGGGAGLLSLPFWLVAEARGKCQR